ncbi:hypothetical protein HaLaN_27821 [Haematococcus lacustris]|uniref:Uncharacterized protein n=1 Tax=Haematococcus lacustris TaxID=44745 RepID=A0A6A0A9U9_HAELA|nr:hypothetical protein HaLaN_27821 [Haematococcus lacustris]
MPSHELITAEGEPLGYTTVPHAAAADLMSVLLFLLHPQWLYAKQLQAGKTPAAALSKAVECMHTIHGFTMCMASVGGPAGHRPIPHCGLAAGPHAWSVSQCQSVTHLQQTAQVLVVAGVEGARHSGRGGRCALLPAVPANKECLPQPQHLAGRATEGRCQKP